MRVAADNRVIDIDRESVDIAIRYSLRDTVPDGAAWMFGESVVPVAHPTLDVRGLDARELQRHVLLEFDDPSRPWLQWSEWLSARGLSRVRPKHAALQPVRPDRARGPGRPRHRVGRLALIAPMLADRRLAAVGGNRPAPPNTPTGWSATRAAARPTPTW